MKDIFEEQRSYISYFFEHFDYVKAEEILQCFISCEGNIIFTGVGKSGIIAEKLASTMLSTGTTALCIPCLNALHGDLGILQAKDLFVIISKSGESEEILQLIPFVRKKGAKIISWVCNPDSRLAKASDLWIYLPLLRELCPFDLAPTTSAALQLLFGDVLTVAMMRQKKFSLENYAMNHPAGSIGKKISLQVEDIMVKGEDIPLCKEGDILIDVLHHLSEKKCGCLVVADPLQKLTGIFTDGDLRRALQRKGVEVLSQTLSSLMSRAPRTIGKKDQAFKALHEMEGDPQKPITVLPVVEGDNVIGLVRMHDILQLGLK